MDYDFDTAVRPLFFVLEKTSLIYDLDERNGFENILSFIYFWNVTNHFFSTKFYFFCHIDSEIEM